MKRRSKGPGHQLGWGFGGLAGVVFLLLTSQLAGAADNPSTLGKKCRGGEDRACDRLVELALTDPDRAIRKAAVEAIEDPAALGRVLLETTDRSVRKQALAQMDESALVQLLFEHPEAVKTRGLGSDVVWKIKDEQLLARVARDAEDWTVRLAAVMRIEDDGLLAELLRTEEHPQVRIGAARRVEDWNAISGALTERGIGIGRVEGRVTPESVSPQGVDVRLIRIEPATGGMTKWQSSKTFDAKTDADGRFGFTVESGSYVVMARDGDSWTYRVGMGDPRVASVKIDASTGLRATSIITLRYEVGPGALVTTDELGVLRDLEPIEPVGGAVVSTRHPTLRWKALDGATLYIVSLAKADARGSALLTEKIFDRRRVTTTELRVDETLTPGESYVWWVDAYDEENKRIGGFSRESQKGSFRVASSSSAGR